ncbi:MAG: hypothetical protein U0X86_001183 [Wolbachia endosymbiont of Xenopsylla cheopis]
MSNFKFDSGVNFFDHFETDPLINDIERYRSLWKAVILQAATDSISNNRRTEIQLEKKKAIEWLFDSNQDFDVVCEYAGYKPAYVRNKARSIIKEKLSKLAYGYQYHQENSTVI